MNEDLPVKRSQLFPDRQLPACPEPILSPETAEKARNVWYALGYAESVLECASRELAAGNQAEAAACLARVRAALEAAEPGYRPPPLATGEVATRPLGGAR